jgi:hypothetical protein
MYITNQILLFQLQLNLGLDAKAEIIKECYDGEGGHHMALPNATQSTHRLEL